MTEAGTLLRWVILGSCVLGDHRGPEVLAAGPGPGRLSSAGRGYGSLTYGASSWPPHTPQRSSRPGEPVALRDHALIAGPSELHVGVEPVPQRVAHQVDGERG